MITINGNNFTATWFNSFSLSFRISSLIKMFIAPSRTVYLQQKKQGWSASLILWARIFLYNASNFVIRNQKANEICEKWTLSNTTQDSSSCYNKRDLNFSYDKTLNQLSPLIILKSWGAGGRGRREIHAYHFSSFERSALWKRPNRLETVTSELICPLKIYKQNWERESKW